MENNADSYLHKKFKKQLSIEPKSQNYDKENKDSPRVMESSEEKISEFKNHGECNKVMETKIRIDNNDIVPNKSTNQNSSFVLNISNLSKSSISVENCITNQQFSKSCISYVVSNNQKNDECSKPISFDTTFSTFPTNAIISTSIVTTSSIINNLYSKDNYENKEDVSPHDFQEDCTLKINPTEESSDVKVEEIQPPPDRNSSGKYVCTYCNLVCSKPSVLQKHIRAHTNERPYPCISCGFSFKTRSNLYKHCRSRTHANRVMGSKSQQSTNEIDNQKNFTSTKICPNQLETREDEYIGNAKLKPYKPRFHSSKHFLENISKENINEEKQNSKHATSELLSHHINEIINKNNSIVNSREATYIKKRINDLIVDNVNNNEYVQKFNRSDSIHSTSTIEPINSDEPLNLTNKNRKRCLSEVSEPVVQKSLIKELLLKNLYSSDMQCPYCKMIFQTVTELDVHKYRNCKGKPLGARYTRSSSVNVASILTQNKNAFDNIPQLQNTVFPLSSPGPFLGKTRLVDTDKTKSFSFDSGNLPLMSPNELPQNYLSPLPFDKEKKNPVKLFGGEVKIHLLGETKSFKIDNKNDECALEQNFMEYGGKLSENRVIKSSLQSGGTVLTNKGNYTKKEIRSQQDVIRVYENTLVSPSIDIAGIGKTKFNFDHQSDRMAECMQPEIILKHADSCEISKTYEDVSNTVLYKYTNIMDFSQKAVKMLTPNIKQPNFAIHKPNSFINNLSDENNRPDLLLPNSKLKAHEENDVDKPQNLTLSLGLDVSIRNNSIKKQVPQSKEYCDHQLVTSISSLYNPVNLLVNGKVIRYVPGIPGPIAAENPIDILNDKNIVSVERSASKDLLQMNTVVDSKSDLTNENLKPSKFNHSIYIERTIEELNRSPKSDTLEIKTDFYSKSPEIIPLKISETCVSAKTLEIKSQERDNNKDTKKFVRPNSLALKPTTASLKQHHGLTPTMFNQILISPDTPRVAKKYAEHFLHGNYFSYLGLKSSTKPVYCTLNKTQPFYVPHFKKLSMYSEWRQQDTKTDKLYVTNYDSRQKSQRYTTAGKTSASLIIHSSYKFLVSEVPSVKPENEDEQRNKSILGGYECNNDYTYIRGRGRGRYVCDQCGIRCKKPSMLKKHIRTHSNDRPYTCNHCNFSFKTKGNLTKHMKSKVHSKNSTAGSNSSSCTQQSATPSSESDTEDSGMDSSDESTRQQEHEAAYGLLSLSQKPQTNSHLQSDRNLLQGCNTLSINELFMSSEEIAYVSKTNYAKNKILDHCNSLSFAGTNNINQTTMVTISEETTEARNLRNYLGKSSVNRPLTYPYNSTVSIEGDELSLPTSDITKCNETILNMENISETKCIKQFHVIQKYATSPVSPKISEHENSRKNENEKILDNIQDGQDTEKLLLCDIKNSSICASRILPTLKLNDIEIQHENVSDLRKRKFPIIENDYKNKMQRNDEVMDLSRTAVVQRQDKNGIVEGHHLCSNASQSTLVISESPEKVQINEEGEYQFDKSENINCKTNDIIDNGTVIILSSMESEDHNINYIKEHHNSTDHSKPVGYDNSAMETLADIATQREKLDKNTLAQSVATQFLKLATKNEKIDGTRDSNTYSLVNKDVNDIIVKSEGNKSCTICSKNFNKPSQLRLHMNIHYLERPFRCESCSVSFRTKGHLQKHERSASHHNKLSSSPALSSSEPRPFKCTDCNIAFRIHGHLAKHLRSKMHIMKLECLAKIPFGLYAELERSNSLLTEINTCDGDQCLESLKTLAKKVFINDPNKLNQVELTVNDDADS